MSRRHKGGSYSVDIIMNRMYVEVDYFIEQSSDSELPADSENCHGAG